MSKSKQPYRHVFKYCEPSIPGLGLGFINRKYFDPATWEPLLSTAVGRGQYGKFVTLMVERIRSKESSCDETRNFVDLVGTERNWDFLKVAMPHLPELKEPYPRDAKNFEMFLLFTLKPILRRRDIRETQSDVPVSTGYGNGLDKTAEQALRRMMFGPDRGAVESAGMKRLFKSTLELGIPQPALDLSVRDATEPGRDTERYHDSLPINLPMSHADASIGTPRIEAFEDPLAQEPESPPLSFTSTLLNSGRAPSLALDPQGSDVLIRDFAMEPAERTE